MTPTTLQAAAETGREELPSASGGPPGGVDPANPEPARRDTRSRSRTWVGLAVSALVHLIAIALYPAWAIDPGGFVPPTISPEGTPEGTRVLRIIELTEAPSDPDPPTEIADVEPVEAPRTDVIDEPPPVEVVIEPPPARRTAAERLRPGDVDPRLWEIASEITDLRPEELAELQLIWELEDLGDSIAAFEAAAAAALDWTHTDDEGRRWGVADGKLHLGDVAIPFPFSFGGPLNNDAARRSADEADIARAAVRGAAHENMKERIRAIRERLDRERERERSRQNPPDTTRSRR